MPKAGERGRRSGNKPPLFTKPSSFARLSAKALEAGIEVEYFQEMVRLNNLVPDQSMETAEQWPWDIRIYTLGRFQIILHGHKTGQHWKGSQKTISLLKALISFGSADV